MKLVRLKQSIQSHVSLNKTLSWNQKSYSLMTKILRWWLEFGRHTASPFQLKHFRFNEMQRIKHVLQFEKYEGMQLLKFYSVWFFTAIPLKCFWLGFDLSSNTWLSRDVTQRLKKSAWHPRSKPDWFTKCYIIIRSNKHRLKGKIAHFGVSNS